MKDLIRRFFWFCAGVDFHNFNSVIDSYTYSAIGVSVFFTAVLAALSGAYAVYTLFGSPLVSISFGILWGIIIFNLDRFINLSIREFTSTSPIKVMLSMIPRFLLSVFLAIIVASPIQLKLFESEINTELQKEAVAYTVQQKAAIEAEIERQIVEKQNDINEREKSITERRERINNLYEEIYAEVEGTARTRHAGKGAVYRLKLNQLQDEVERTSELNEPDKKIIQQRAAEIYELEKANYNSIKNPEKSYLQSNVENSVSSRISALYKLVKLNPQIRAVNLGILILFLLLFITPQLQSLLTKKMNYANALEKADEESEKVGSKLQEAFDRAIDFSALTKHK